MTPSEHRYKIGFAALLAATGSAYAAWRVLRRTTPRPANANTPASRIYLGSLGADFAISLMGDALNDEGADVSAMRNAASATTPAGVDLESFAQTVLALAMKIEPNPTAKGLARGRFGRKVFIAAIRRALRDTEHKRLSREDVDELLVDANREGLLSLARADLAAVMDPTELRESHIHHLNADFHFVVADQERNVLPADHTGHLVVRARYREPAEYPGGYRPVSTWKVDEVDTLEQAKKEAIAHRARLKGEGQWTTDHVMRIVAPNGDQYELITERGRDVWRER